MTAAAQPSVIEPPPHGGRRGVGRWVIVALACILTLTLVFTAQDAVRLAASGRPFEPVPMLLTNALDWTVWGLLAPAIALMTRRYRLDDSSQRGRRVAVWIGFAILCSLAASLITGPVLRLSGALTLPPGFAMPPWSRFLAAWIAQSGAWNLVSFCMIAGVFHAALYYTDLRARQLREADLEARLARSELNVLRMQLQPHFFFNALHTVSALMVTDVPTAHRVLAALSDLVRSSLDHTAQQEIPLRDELEFVHRYIEIQQARFRDRLSVEVQVPDELLDALVPSLVLQPLVDNAIRHGIEAHRRRGHIWVRAARDGATLELRVRDDASPDPGVATPATMPSRARSGIGLANIGARLAQLYGTAHTFTAGRDADGCFTVTLRLPYHREPAPLAAHAVSR